MQISQCGVFVCGGLILNIPVHIVLVCTQTLAIWYCMYMYMQFLWCAYWSWKPNIHNSAWGSSDLAAHCIHYTAFFLLASLPPQWIWRLTPNINFIKNERTKNTCASQRYDVMMHEIDGLVNLVGKAKVSTPIAEVCNDWMWSGGGGWKQRLWRHVLNQHTLEQRDSHEW